MKNIPRYVVRDKRRFRIFAEMDGVYVCFDAGDIAVAKRVAKDYPYLSTEVFFIPINP